MDSASPLVSAICRAVASAPSTLMSAHITRAPSRAKLSAVALPIPDAAPVTTATLSFSRIDFSYLAGCVGRPRVRSLRSQTIAPPPAGQGYPLHADGPTPDRRHAESSSDQLIAPLPPFGRGEGGEGPRRYGTTEHLCRGVQRGGAPE